MQNEIELTIDESYVDWGLREGIREIIQNSIDGEKAGFKSTIAYDRDTQTLRVSNQGAKLPRKSLLLGFTTKRDDKQAIGQFGEGYKLGCLAVVRAGHVVWIKNGTEMWQPRIRHSDVFDQNVLVFNIKEVSDGFDGVEFTVLGLSPEAWISCQQQFLRYQDTQTIETELGDVIFSPDLAGTIFMGGIQIAKVDDYHFGYNLKPKSIRIDRDRRMVNEKEISALTTNIWNAAYLKNKEHIDHIEELLKLKCDDLADMKYSWNCANGLITDLVKRFKQRYGEKAYPVSDQKTLNFVQMLGMTAVIVEDYYGMVLRHDLGTIAQLEEQVSKSITRHYKTEELSDVERFNFDKCMKILRRASSDAKFPQIQIVDFSGDNLRGLHIKDPASSKVLVSRNVLHSMAETMEVLIHEFCHDYGKDYSQEHVHEMGSLWKRVFTQVYTRGMDA